MRACCAALVLLFTLLVTACGHGQATTGPSAKPSASGSPSSAPTAVQGSALPVAASGPGRCQPFQLKITVEPWPPATGNDMTSVRLVNQSGAPCYLGGYAGVELDDASGHHLGDAQRST